MSKKSKPPKEKDSVSSECIPTCPYFPDMSVQPGEWIWDDELPIKRRKEKKIFRCSYDNHVIDWGAKCPRERGRNV